MAKRGIATTQGAYTKPDSEFRETALAARLEASSSLRLPVSLMPSTPSPARQLHLGVSPQASHDPAFIASIARKAEDARFDFFFLGDALATSAEQQYVFPSQTVRLEPFTMMGYVAAQTQRIGLIATANTTYADPYHIARQTASLDHLSRGRLAWNVVTGADERAAKNFGRDHHWDNSRRYDYAEELVDVVSKLWDSWEDEALIGDQDAGLLVDPRKLHAIEHEGNFFQVKGPINVARPPQGQIPLVNAGTSARSRAFGAARSTVVFAGVPTFEAAQSFYAEIKAGAVANGRRAEDVSILPGLVPYVGRTSDDAYALYQRLSALIAAKLDIAALERDIHIPLAGLTGDDPFPSFDETDASLSLARLFITQARKLNRTDRPTVRHVFEYSIARGRGHFLAIGSAEEVADTIEHWFENGAADGFNICPPHLPGGLDDFVDLVLPILRARGLFREDYEGDTFGAHFGLGKRPASRFEGTVAGAQAEPGRITETHHRVV